MSVVLYLRAACLSDSLSALISQTSVTLMPTRLAPAPRRRIRGQPHHVEGMAMLRAPDLDVPRQAN